MSHKMNGFLLILSGVPQRFVAQISGCSELSKVLYINCKDLSWYPGSSCILPGVQQNEVSAATEDPSQPVPAQMLVQQPVKLQATSNEVQTHHRHNPANRHLSPADMASANPWRE